MGYDSVVEVLTRCGCMGSERELMVLTAGSLYNTLWVCIAEYIGKRRRNRKPVKLTRDASIVHPLNQWSAL